MQAEQQTDPMFARLTESEKECLRRRLLPQTAKEMAIDLCISPHAVEKRLKMARAKLGVSSSLAAARLLANAEQYQSLVPQSSDLRGDEAMADKGSAATVTMDRGSRRLREGFIMLAMLLTISVLAQNTPARLYSPGTVQNEHSQDIPIRKVGMDEAAAFIRMEFHQKDKDGSGDLDASEVSQMEARDKRRDPRLPVAPPAHLPDPAAERKWMEMMDRNRDGKVSEEEYVAYLMPWTLWQGVPADWQPAP